MQLNEQEEKMVDWLRKQHKAWRMNRAIILVGALFMLYQGVRILWSGQSQDLSLIYFAFSFYFFSYTLGSWSGRPEISLLLRLIEEKKKDSQP